MMMQRMQRLEMLRYVICRENISVQNSSRDCKYKGQKIECVYRKVTEYTVDPSRVYDNIDAMRKLRKMFYLPVTTPKDIEKYAQGV